MEIFKLFGSILIDSSEAEKSISKTEEKADGLGTKLANGIGTAAKWAAGVATAAASVGTAIVAAAKDSADALGDIDDAAQRMGTDAETLQELEYVAKMSGLELSDLEKAAKKLEGTDLNLDEAIDQIMSLGTAEEQTNKAIELFGENIAYNLQPLLNHGAEGIQEFKDQAHELGIIMSNETVEAGANFGDMFDALSSSFESMKTSLVSNLMPYAIEIMDWIMENLPMIQETLTSVVDAVIPIVQPVLDLLMEIIPPLFNKIKELLDWLVPYITPIINSIKTLVEGIMKLLEGDLDGFIENFKDALIGLGKALFNIGKEIFTSLWDGLKSVWDSIKNWLSDKVDWITSKFSWLFQSAADKMSSVEGLDGSHASGLNYVPYDGYVAELHRGESVMNAGAVDRLLEKIDGLSQAQSSGPIELTLNIDGKAFARATYNNIKDESKRRGSSLVLV